MRSSRERDSEGLRPGGRRGCRGLLSQDMLQEEDFLQTVVSAYQAGSRVVVTGYSMGGMLAQLFVLFLGERIHR